MSTKQNIKERDEAIARLREILKPGDTVYTVVRHVSASGMSRVIDLYHFSIRGGKIHKSWLSGLAARAIGWRRDAKHDGIKVQGCGMDMGFHVVSTLSRVLYPEADRPDYVLTQEWL